MYFSVRLSWSSDSAAQDSKLLKQLRALFADPRDFAATSSPIWSSQVLYQTAAYVPALRPLSLYATQQGIVTLQEQSKRLRYSGGRSDACLLVRSRLLFVTAHGIAFLHLLEALLPRLQPLQLALQGTQWMAYQEYVGYRALLLIPHAPILMAFYDFYALNIPMVLPSKLYMLKLLQVRGHALEKRPLEDFDISYTQARCETTGPACHQDQTTCDSLFPASPMDIWPADVLDAGRLVDLMSFYSWPGVLVFDSLHVAIDALKSPDVEERADMMARRQRDHEKEILDIYRRSVLPLLPASTSS